MLVYGRNIAKIILENNIKVQKIILQENFNDEIINSLIRKKKLEVKYFSKSEIDNLANGNHQGIIIYIGEYLYTPINDLIQNAKLLVVLDHLEDPHNLGAIIRTCEASGVDGIIIPKDRQVLVNATVVKTSAGAIFNTKIACVSNINNTIKELKKENFWIVGTALENSIDYRKIDYPEKIALVIGNEGSGMSKLVTSTCDFIANIPMYGKVNSLNASVATGIMIYEVIHNRK